MKSFQKKNIALHFFYLFLFIQVKIVRNQTLLQWAKRTHIWENSLKVKNKLYSRADLTERFLIIAHFLYN